MSQAAELRTEVGLKDLVLFNIAAVVGVRWLAAAAHAGPGSTFLWLTAAAFFFVPSALAVSRLSARFPEEGGIYVWTKYAFGPWHGFLCGWCYWLSNLFYFPNLLLAGVAMAGYMLPPGPATVLEQRGVMIAACLALLWTALLTNLVGVRVGKWTENIGGAATYAVGAALVALGAAVAVKYGSASTLAWFPEWKLERVNFWSQIAFAFGGLELGAVMSREIRNPSRTVPRAALVSGIAICAFYILGTMAMLALIESSEINVLTGLAQAGKRAGERLDLPWLTPAMAGLITLGVMGQLGAWLGGGARLPFVIGLDQYLPPAFARLHPRWGTPHVAIVVQGVACTVFLLVLQLGDNLRTGYQLLVDMTVITYFIPFVYLFLTAWKHGLWSAAAGLTVTLAAIGFSMMPPAGAASWWLFEVKLVGGSVLLVLAGRLCFVRGRRAG
jgi:amino acid transporter